MRWFQTNHQTPTLTGVKRLCRVIATESDLAPVMNTCGVTLLEIELKACRAARHDRNEADDAQSTQVLRHL